MLAVIIIFSSSLARATASQLNSASLTLGNPNPNQATTYTATASGFTTATALECVEVELNTAADGSGAVPTGVTTTGSSLDSSTLITSGSWAVDNSINGSLRITNGSGESPAASGNVVWSSVTNGNTEGSTYYAILTTYSDSSCNTAVDSVTVAYVYTAGEPVTLGIGATLTFSCESVLSGQNVNGAATNTDSTPSGIAYGVLTTAANGISAHDLEVSTNAAGGYAVYIRHSTDLQTPGGSAINAHSGNNSTPTSFPAAGTEAWGYTTEDSSLSGVTPDRFTSSGGNRWAGFSSTNDEVVYETVASPSTQTTRVGHQVGIAADTPAGNYQTSIIYTIVATY